MNRFILVILALVLGCALHGQEKKHFVLYAVLVSDTGVRLADGPLWMMDKGDTFPVVMFKEQQTKVVLQLAATTFLTTAANVKIIEEKDLTAAQLATYQNNVEHYLASRAQKLKEDAK